MTIVSRASIAGVWDYDATDPELTHLPGKTAGQIGFGMDRVFDGSFADTNAVYMSSGKNGSCIVLDFPALPEIGYAPNKGVYVSEIVVGHTGNCNLPYSLYWSDTATNKNQAIVWNPVPNAQNVTTPGITNFILRSRVRFMKYVFENTTGDNSLTEIQVKGYVSDMPQVVSGYSIASFYNASGGLETGEFGGGNNSFWGTRTPGQQLFNNVFTDYNMWPKAPDNGYVVVDFTSTNAPAHLSEYYVTEMWVGANGLKKFTLQYSEDGSTWEDVEGAVTNTCNGIGKYAVGKIAKKVRYIWAEGSMWDFSTEYLAEFQVWGINPEDAPCTHPSYTAWEVSVPATCTERATLARSCTVCGEEFTKPSDGQSLGHDYVTTLDRPGHFSQRKDFPDHRRYGSGSIACSRCDFRLDFPVALDLVTNRVDGVPICGMRTEGIVRFADVTVSSENNPQWGPGGKKIIDGVWNVSQEWPYWTTSTTNGQYADFAFGTTIDLTAVEFSVYNHGYVLEFCSIDDDTGEETKFGEYVVVRDDTVVGTKTVTEKIVDPATGEETEIEVEKEVTADYQRISVPFFETPVRHLRVRIADQEPISLWGCMGIRVIEIHPWGTVPGASDFETEKTTLIIFK